MKAVCHIVDSRLCAARETQKMRCQNLILRVDLRVDLGGYVPHGRRGRRAAKLI
jgi:hypothetical protein